MGKKYVVEIGRLERLYKAYVNGNGKPNITWLAPEVDLTPYTEPDLEQVRKEGYKEGREAGIKDGKCEAWEAARKIIHMPEGDLLNIFTECYSAVCTALQVVLKYDASEAIEKIRQYEQKQEMDGLRQNIQTIVDQCGYTLEEIAEVLKEMRDDGNRIQEAMSDDY